DGERTQPIAEDRARPGAAGSDSHKTPSVDAPAGSSPVLWVKPGEQVELFPEPGGEEPVKTVDRQTEFGSPTVFSVLDSRGRWAAVTTPYTANGELAWVRLDPRRIGTGFVDHRIEVDLSERRATLLQGDQPLRGFSVTVGAPDSPTPTGSFAITDTFKGDLSPVYGCCALAISANQPLRPSGWIGGSRIAFHGTTGSLGVAASNGCVRASDSDLIAMLNTVELGTPVEIHE
ncbi:MAG: L,D-transpeptidase, partial [Solirubrobacterales bacterium]|nr:L,D-transpeptidase [Solirubrobacterales bacterium]